jgi:uncharacterized C2H2 Zn-finger protein
LTIYQGEPEENCQECCEVFDTVDSSMTHVEKYHEGFIFWQRVSEPKETCRDRGDAQDTENDVRTHVENHHIGCGKDKSPERLVSEPETKETCGKCGYIFRRTANLQTHVQKYHEEELEVENTRHCGTSLE